MTHVARIPGRVARRLRGFASTDQSRPILHDANLRKGRLRAADGKVLVDLPLTEDGSVHGPRVSADHPEWVLPVDVLRRKVSETLVVGLDSGEVRVEDGDGNVIARLPDLEEDESYPNVDRVTGAERDRTPIAEALVSPTYLRTVAQLVEDMGRAEDVETPGVILEITDGGPGTETRRAIRFGARLGDDVEFLGLVMPIVRPQ